VAKALNDRTLDHAAVLSYSRAWDIAVMKTSAMCCGFLLTFLGALYVLKSRDQSYKLKLSGLDKENTLETSSPGLVMITFGVALVITSILKETSVEYTAPSQILSPAGARGQTAPDSKSDIPAASEPTG
jgi:cytochrome c biogenesis factor